MRDGEATEVITVFTPKMIEALSHAHHIQIPPDGPCTDLAKAIFGDSIIDAYMKNGVMHTKLPYKVSFVQITFDIPKGDLCQKS